ncbi:hypothetical protein [Sphingobium nicotianae]|uniref:Lipoprotein n=1 Tax=Sphingobium nicotianae TaxID=2782607 RepID=A0A9X1IQA9_9SPHN|nr:hypothetical protein [Sphingobium nicotianae]MBT2186405.1 hypothetical protein [Sphingobium nicotianae]
MMKIHAQLLALFLLALAGCNQMTASNEAGGMGDGNGRYAGVGIYPADRLWNEVQGAPEEKDAAAAKLADDGQIIVLVDRQTGEVRQCGNRSGFCTAMNPWSGRSAGDVPSAPVRLSRHADQLDAADNVAAVAEPANSARR